MARKTRSSAIAVIADRTACSILTLFFAIATSRPLNKKIRSLSVRGCNNYCGSASTISSPHTSAAPAGPAGCSRTVRSRHRVIVDKRLETSRAFSIGVSAWVHIP